MGNVTINNIVVRMNHDKFRVLKVSKDYSIEDTSKVMSDVEAIYYIHDNSISNQDVSWMNIDDEMVVNIFWGI